MTGTKWLCLICLILTFDGTKWINILICLMPLFTKKRNLYSFNRWLWMILINWIGVPVFRTSATIFANTASDTLKIKTKSKRLFHIFYQNNTKGNCEIKYEMLFSNFTFCLANESAIYTIFESILVGRIITNSGSSLQAPGVSTCICLIYYWKLDHSGINY